MGNDPEPAAEPPFTPLQGQYLAYIKAYTLLHRIPPAERDMQEFFRVTPPAVHDIVLKQELRGLIERVPGKARSIRVLVASDKLPSLQDSAEQRTAGRRRTRG